MNVFEPGSEGGALSLGRTGTADELAMLGMCDQAAEALIPTKEAVQPPLGPGLP